MKTCPLARPARLLVLLALCAGSSAHAFSQGAGVHASGGTPQGHEWLTVHSALEVLGVEKMTQGDPRSKSSVTKARNLAVPAAIKQQLVAEKVSDSQYGSHLKKVLATVHGQRWVDIAGMNIVKNKTGYKYDCFDGIPQTPDEFQHDHFCRQRGEEGAAGAIRAINDSVARFKRYFAEAAVAPAGTIKFWDGGIAAAEYTADRNFFLFGRALHLFQDSFSTEHAHRVPNDGFQTVRGIKTYLCSKGSDQHTHQKPIAATAAWGSLASNGDIIWKTAANDWTTRNVKEHALVALEASKDLWAAFLRVMALPASQRSAAAQREANTLATNWMSMDEAAINQRYDAKNPEAAKEAGWVGFNAKDQADCDAHLGATAQEPLMTKINEARKWCTYQIKFKDAKRYKDVDKYLNIPYYWDWKGLTWDTPPATFKAQNARY
jgi:hypothetical protein